MSLLYAAILMVLNLGELLTAGLLFSALSFAAAVGLVIAQNLRRREPSGPALMASLGVYTIATLATLVLTGSSWEALVPPALGLAASIGAHRVLSNFTAAGRLLLVAHVQLMLFGLLWGAWFIATIPVSTFTRALMFAGYPLFVLTLPAQLVTTLEHWEVLCRRNWLRPRTPLPSKSRDHYPKVSLHVPVCSEPPDMVMATLDALAQFRYPNFEVLVIDNNTQDSNLWKPVEAHCQHLGERFRFFHVERLPGAKAGALNFALRHTAPDVELVGVIDSDYQAESDFLERLVGYFDDPRMGFVQTPHDYREWQARLYLRMCYWEYKYFFETVLVSRNERDSAITVGTMCLIRRKALEEAGGWAEWCATEDSELAIRIHALGYSGVYLNTTFGRGLIPETFSGYKQQRFRWTYGPVQELKHHFRLYLPGALGRPSALSAAQKVHHLNHGLAHFNIGLGLLLLPVGVAVITSMLVHREVVHVPLVLWVTAPVLLITGFVLHWLVYRVVMVCSWKDELGALVASMALSYTIATASLWALFTRRIPWRRTDKFKAVPLGLGALGCVRTELLLGVATLLFAIGALAAVPQFGFHLLILLIIGAICQSFNYLAAPALALLAERDIRARRVTSSEQLDLLLAESTATEQV